MYVDHTRWNPYLVPPLPEWATPADELLWDLHFSTWEDRLFRHEHLVRYPDRLALAMAQRYRKTLDDQGIPAANVELRETTESLSTLTVRLSASDDELSDAAKAYAKACGRIAARQSDPDVAYLYLSQYAEERGVAPPSLEQYTVIGAIRRLGCSKWWRRALRKTHGQAMEKHAIVLGLVHRKAAPYIGDDNFRRIEQRGLRNREMLEAFEATNEQGQSYTLAQLSDRSVSNPKIRRSELMVRMRGFERVADLVGHAGVFLTLTAPSRFHARRSASGEANPKWDGSSPKDAQRHLRTLWSRARSALGRRKIYPYGFRIAEPHHDGTPHWHLLLFVPQDQVQSLIDVCRHYALQEDPDEPGAQENRFKAVLIDQSKGSATGYVAKYVSKNIDGFGVDGDELGHDATDSAQRVKAWASLWSIRQFQQIGGPKVTVWRELRRIHQPVTESPAIEAARQAADAGDWAAYILAMGGIHCPREECPVWLHKVWSDKEGQYGEPLGEIIQGVAAEGCHVQTRQEWTIALKPLEAEEQAETPPYSLIDLTPRGEHSTAPIADWHPIAQEDEHPDNPKALSFAWERQQKIRLAANPPSSDCPRSGQPSVAVRRPWSPVNNCTQPLRFDVTLEAGNGINPIIRGNTSCCQDFGPP